MKITNLTEMKEGDEGKIVDIAAGWLALKRLADLGLTVNTKIKIFKKAPFYGPIEIKCRGTKLAIGYGLCRKIFVTTNEAKK